MVEPSFATCFLQGPGDFASRSIMEIIGLIVWLTGVINLLTNPPDPSSYDREVQAKTQHRFALSWDWSVPTRNATHVGPFPSCEDRILLEWFVQCPHVERQPH